MTEQTENDIVSTCGFFSILLILYANTRCMLNVDFLATVIVSSGSY